jgi:aspartate ammonia-lyase
VKPDGIVRDQSWIRKGTNSEPEEPMPRPSVQGSDGEAPTRLERDPLGPIAVPQAALYGAQTERGRANFRVSGLTLADRPELIAALGQVKAASVRANQELGEVPADLASVILQAAREVAANELDEHFPLDVVQGGGGTATNMNANEVIANRAADLLGRPRGVYDLVNPNNHVNRSQSTNDVYPTALQLAVVVRSGQAVEGVRYLAEAIRSAGEKVGGLLRIGRTCLRDALPVEIRATGNGEASALERCARDLEAASAELLAVPLGATAVGTGFGAPDGYKELAVRYLAEESGLAVTPVKDPYDALSHLDKFIAVASHLVRSALAMAKIAADLRILSSGPLGGIDEVTLPTVQVGSSIMPGKVNPVMPELVMQVSFEVRGAAAIVEAAAASGELELNVMEPVVARHLLGALADVGAVAHLFADRCVAGLEWREDALAQHLSSSFADRVELARRDGYAAAYESSPDTGGS